MGEDLKQITDTKEISKLQKGMKVTVSYDPPEQHVHIITDILKF